jgi:hypothetical protein
METKENIFTLAIKTKTPILIKIQIASCYYLHEQAI